MVAWRMLISSISSTLAMPTPISAQAVSLARSASRRAASSFLESLRPSGQFEMSIMTAAATTGPASGPRPASSTPQTSREGAPSSVSKA